MLDLQRLSLALADAAISRGRDSAAERLRQCADTFHAVKAGDVLNAEEAALCVALGDALMQRADELDAE